MEIIDGARFAQQEVPYRDHYLSDNLDTEFAVHIVHCVDGFRDHSITYIFYRYHPVIELISAYIVANLLVRLPGFEHHVGLAIKILPRRHVAERNFARAEITHLPYPVLHLILPNCGSRND